MIMEQLGKGWIISLVIPAAGGLPRSLGRNMTKFGLDKYLQSEITKRVILLVCHVVKSSAEEFWRKLS
jgi:hypothetical protein